MMNNQQTNTPKRYSLVPTIDDLTGFAQKTSDSSNSLLSLQSSLNSDPLKIVSFAVADRKDSIGIEPSIKTTLPVKVDTIISFQNKSYVANLSSPRSERPVENSVTNSLRTLETPIVKPLADVDSVISKGDKPQGTNFAFASQQTFHSVSPEATLTLDTINANSLSRIDLTPYQPIGWDGPIVISTVVGTHTNAQTITTADTLYIDFAIINNGPDYVLFENFKYTLSLDGVLWGSVTKYPPFYTYPPILNQDSMSAPLSAGTHEFILTVDSENTVQETNENNNVAHKVFTVLGTTPPPTLSINDISINEVSSGVSIATFTVTLSTVATSNVTVNYATANGTGSSAAVAPDDYTYSSGSLTFTPGQTSKTISVTIIGDTVVEANETFFVNLSGATNAIIADNQGVGTILDDDSTPPVITVVATDANQPEGNSGTKAFTFNVTRAVNTTGINAVNWAATGSGTNPANAADFLNGVLPSGAVNFAAGETSKVITVNVQGDTTVEPNENFTLTLSNPTNGATITAATAVGTIQNDDASTSNLKLLGVSFDNHLYDLNVQTGLASNPRFTQKALIDIAQAPDGKLYGIAVNFGYLYQINPDTGNSITVTMVSGLVFEGDLALDPTTGVMYGVLQQIVYPTLSSINITNGKTTEIAKIKGGNQIRDISGLAFDPNGSLYALDTTNDELLQINKLSGEVLRSTPLITSAGQTVDLGSTAGMDFNPITGELFVADGDGVADLGTNKLYTLNITNGVLNSIGDLGLPKGLSGLEFVWTDMPTAPTLAIAATNANQPEGNSETKAFTFTVNRNINTTGTNAVNWAVAGSGTSQANAADFLNSVLPSGAVSFAAGETSKVITVNVQGDTTVEPNENFTVTLSNPTNGATITTATAIGTILNDDTAVPTLAIAATNANQTEGTSGTKPFTFTITRAANTTGANAVNWAVTGSGASPANPTDFAGGVLPTGSVSWTAGDTISKVITVNVQGDTTVEPNENFTVTLSNPTNGATITTAILAGGLGNDILTSGNGFDTFQFASRLEGIDTLTDFNVSQDIIQVSGAGFGGGLVTGETISASQLSFSLGAITPSTRFIFDKPTGKLYFDIDGSGSNASVQLASLTANLGLTADNIFAA